MRLGCVVLAHALPGQLASLLSILQHPQVRLYLHIDRRKPIAPFRRALEEAGVDNLSLLPRRASPWGSIDVVDAELDGLAASVNDGCDYMVVLSGQDFPVQPVDRILAFLQDQGSRSYMRYWRPGEAGALGMTDWNGRFRTELYAYRVLGRTVACLPRGEDISFLNFRGRVLNQLLRFRTALKSRRRHPAYVSPFVGTTWWNLSRLAAEYVLDFVEEHPDFRRYHTHTWTPDEMFFQSILLGSGFADRHEVVRDDLRFVDWSEAAAHPRVLTIEDVPEMLQSGKLFARKFDESVDAQVLTELRAKLGA